MAALWSKELGRSISYVGDDLATLEQRFRAFIPASIAYDIVVMMRRYQLDGAVATAAQIEKLERLLGHSPRSYRDFARETATTWKNA